MANEELHYWRKQAHYWFDQIWRKPIRLSTRYKAYGWLAREMKLSREDTHIALFEVEECKEVIRLCKERLSKRKNKINDKWERSKILNDNSKSR